MIRALAILAALLLCACTDDVRVRQQWVPVTVPL